MTQQWDAVIVGAGPAGMSAAAVMAERGLEVALVDEQDSPGGQIYRGVTRPGAGERFREAKDFRDGKKLAERFLRSGACYMPGSTVWFLEPGRVLCLRDGKTVDLRASHIVLAVGAMERPVPFAGWTLPGVMGAGAAHILQKTSGITPRGPVVLAGSGPLLPLVAAHLLEAGAEVTALLDCTPLKNVAAALPFLPLTLGDAPLLWRGAKYMAGILRAKGLTVYRNVASYAALGTTGLEAVSFRCKDKMVELPAATLLTHHGVIPRTHAALSLWLDHTWNERQACWNTVVDRCGKTGRTGIFSAGDCAVVRGGEASALGGEITGLRIAVLQGALSEAQAGKLMTPLWRKLALKRAARPFIDAFFKPRGDMYNVPDDVVVCRCENLTAGDIRTAVAEGITDINEIKLRMRTAMGNCQGRMCGPGIAAIAGLARGVSPREAGMLRVRPPLRPTPLSALNDLT